MLAPEQQSVAYFARGITSTHDLATLLTCGQRQAEREVRWGLAWRALPIAAVYGRSVRHKLTRATTQRPIKGYGGEPDLVGLVVTFQPKRGWCTVTDDCSIAIIGVYEAAADSHAAVP